MSSIRRTSADANICFTCRTEVQSRQTSAKINSGDVDSRGWIWRHGRWLFRNSVKKTEDDLQLVSAAFDLQKINDLHAGDFIHLKTFLTSWNFWDLSSGLCNHLMTSSRFWLFIHRNIHKSGGNTNTELPPRKDVKPHHCDLHGPAHHTRVTYSFYFIVWSNF